MTGNGAAIHTTATELNECMRQCIKAVLVSDASIAVAPVESLNELLHVGEARCSQPVHVAQVVGL